MEAGVGKRAVRKSWEFVAMVAMHMYIMIKNNLIDTQRNPSRST